MILSFFSSDEPGRIVTWAAAMAVPLPPGLTVPWTLAVGFKLHLDGLLRLWVGLRSATVHPFPVRVGVQIDPVGPRRVRTWQAEHAVAEEFLTLVPDVDQLGVDSLVHGRHILDDLAVWSDHLRLEGHTLAQGDSTGGGVPSLGTSTTS